MISQIQQYQFCLDKWVLINQDTCYNLERYGYKFAADKQFIILVQLRSPQLMKNGNLPISGESMLSLSAVYHSKQAKTPSSKQNSFNAWKQGQNEHEIPKSPVQDRKAANKANMDLRSTMGPIKKQKIDSYLRTTTNSFSWNAAGGSPVPFRAIKKDQKPQYESDTKKTNLSKIQNDVVQERDTGQINYNTIMQKLDKKQKLIDQLKKLSEVKISETMRSPYEQNRSGKKDVSPKNSNATVFANSSYSGVSNFTSKYLKDEIKDTMTSTPEKIRYKNDNSFNYLQEKTSNKTPQKIVIKNKNPEQNQFKKNYDGSHTPRSNKPEVEPYVKKNYEESHTPRTNKPEAESYVKKNYEESHTPRANKPEAEPYVKKSYEESHTPRANKPDEPYFQKKWTSKLNLPKTSTNIGQYNSSYASETTNTNQFLSSKLLNEGYTNNFGQKSKQKTNTEAKSNSSSNTSARVEYIDNKNIKDNRETTDYKYGKSVPNNSASKTLSLHDFELQKSLGQGKFGLVHQVIHKQTKSIFALKKVSKAVIKSNYMIDQFLQEIKIQFFCDHQNILRLYGFFDDKENIYLILEYMEEGTLFSQLKKSKNKILGEGQAATKLKHVAAGIKYLHEKGIAHRDIKPENIVMSHGVGKLCDFGWAAICTERRKTYCGTFDYVAPEILEGTEYDMSVDLWCLGVLAFELLAGKAPFYHISRKQTMKKILNVESTAIEFPPHFSKNAVSFIQNLVKKNPEERMTGQDMLRHPFLSQIKQRQM